MPNWIVLRRDSEGAVERVDGMWEADSEAGAIARMCAERNRTDDGGWQAQKPEDQSHVMNWALDQESRGKPKGS